MRKEKASEIFFRFVARYASRITLYDFIWRR